MSFFPLLVFSSCLTWSSFDPGDETDADADSSQDQTAGQSEICPSNFPQRRTITVPAGLTASPLADVPVFVEFSPNDGPVSFRANDTIYAHEKDEGGYWVKVPNVTDAGAQFFAYYGDPGAPDEENAAEVWSNGFVAVWHFGVEQVDMTAGGQPYYEDSVSGLRIVQNDEFARTHQSPGYFGQCLYVRDELESDFQAIGLESVFPASDFTFELWHTIQPLGGTVRRVFGAGDPAFRVEMREGGLRVQATGDSSRFVQWDPEPDTWTKMTAVIGPVEPRRTLAVYLNAEDPNETLPLSLDWDASQTVFFMGSPSTLDFRYDELRVSNTARSEDWVKFLARAESKPSPIIIGEEETR